jgi:hypothetical protein
MNEIPTVSIGGRTFRLVCDRVLRRLTDAETIGLIQDIEAAGEVLVPIIVTQDDDVIDGGHRLEIAAELGLTLDKVPLVVRHVKDQAEAEDLCRRLNVRRRQLTPAERHEQIAKILKADPESSDRKVAAAVGVDHKTVATARQGLQSSGEIPHSPKRTGKDGRTTQPRQTAKRKATAEAKSALAANRIGKNKPVGPPPSRYPHSTRFLSWMQSTLDGVAELLQQDGGVLPAWGLEGDLWDWHEVRTHILPVLNALLEQITCMKRAIEEHLDGQPHSH